VFEGNVAEVKTLLPMLERCVKRHSNKRIIVVADRGLLHLDNVAEVERQQITEKRTLEYILAVPAGRYRDFATVIDGLSFAEAKDSIARVTWGGATGENEHGLRFRVLFILGIGSNAQASTLRRLKQAGR